MTANPPHALSNQQIAHYRQHGYLVIRNLLSVGDADDLFEIVQKQAISNAYPATLTYPEPAKYTISGNSMAAAGLASIAEHPAVVDAVECLLGQPAYLTAYVAYLRTPGDKGSEAHCDYKRWRPVGSSMNWLFAIIPLTDLDASHGSFLVSPGSHKLTRAVDPPGARIRDLTPPDADQLAPFIDPELKAGDLLLVNEHTWHKAPAGTSSSNRCGIFNKYCDVDAPPAAGYYPYSPAARDALSDAGKRLIPVCFDKPITSTRLLIERLSGRESEFLLRRADDDRDRWELPGGDGGEEEDVGWDIGARIGALQALTQTQLGLDVPWMSYIEDVETKEGVCRLYGFTDETELLSDETELADDARVQFDWFTADQLLRLGESDEICDAVQTWQQRDIIRGKGKAIHQSKRQFA